MNPVRAPRAVAIAAALTAIALAPFTTEARAQNAASSEEIAALREQIRLLDQKLRILERNIEISNETAAAEAKKLPTITASEGRIEIASADGANSLRLRGLVQADARFYFDDADAAQDQFLLRRARLIFEGKFADRFTYVAQPEFAGSTVSILDANVGVALNPDTTVQFGRFKTPVGLEQLQSDPVAFFNERSVATNLAPNRDVGVQLSGTVLDKRLAYQTAITNGVIDGGNSPANSANTEGDFTYSARVFATPFFNDKDGALRGLGFGLGGAVGSYRGAQLNSYRTDGQQTFFSHDAATVADGQSRVLSPQANFYRGPLGILAEYFHTGSEVRRGTGASLNHRELNNKAYNLSVGYVLTGEDASFRGVTPRSNFNPSAGTWGAFEIVGRVAELDIDDDAFVDPAGAPLPLAGVNASATKVTTYGVGLNWYLSRTVRFGLDYFYNKFDLAPGATTPTNAVLRDDEQVAIGRVQVSF